MHYYTHFIQQFKLQLSSLSINRIYTYIRIKIERKQNVQIESNDGFWKTIDIYFPRESHESGDCKRILTRPEILWLQVHMTGER